MSSTTKSTRYPNTKIYLLFSLVSILGCSWSAGEDRPKLYEKDIDLHDYCPKSADHRYNHHLLLIDSSDQLHSTALEDIQRVYLSDEQLSRMRPYDRLSIVHMVGLEPAATARTIFSKCRPRNGDKNSEYKNDHHNRWFETPLVLQGNFDEFKRQAHRSIENVAARQEELGDCKRQRCSPLMEYVANISRQDHFGFNEAAGYSDRRLTIVSDLMQNSSRFKFSELCQRKCPSWEEFVKSKKLTSQFLKNFLPNFGGPITIRAFYLGSERLDKGLMKNTTALWESYFAAAQQSDFDFSIAIWGSAG